MDIGTCENRNIYITNIDQILLIKFLWKDTQGKTIVFSWTGQF